MLTHPDGSSRSPTRPKSRLRELELASERLAQRVAHLEAEAEDRVRELDEARQQIARLAEVDQLTGLANRAAFAARLEALLTDERGSGFALFLIDLDHFKKINDTLGHEAGDVLLQHIAMRLFFCASDAEMIARLGGDEFALLIRTGDEHDTVAGIATTLLQAVREPVIFRDHTLDGSCSIGVACFPRDGASPSRVQRQAGLALDRAKLIRSAYTVYEPAMGQEYDARQSLGAELATAIETGQIEAWFQPIYDHASGRIVSAEALARWRHPTRGLLTPAAFLDLAEERGLMHELFACMLRSAAPMIRRRVGRAGLQSLAINVSPSQFAGRNVADDIVALLREIDLPPEALTVEVTEEVMMQNSGAAAAQLQQLANHGVRIALDDFGVGYSNINYLCQFSFDTLKVDRSLTADVVTQPKVRTILAAIVALGRALDLTLVAEGVETEPQATQLASLGLRHQQGYLHGRPLPAAAFEQAITPSLLTA